VNHGRNVENIQRAGADYALSISDVSGEMLSSRLLGLSTRPRDEHRRVARIDATPFAGVTPAAVCSREKGCALLAVERAGTVAPGTTELRLDRGDALWVCGTAEAIRNLTLPSSHGGMAT
jgi:Trk K+ transport system NAD-binding subunit